MYKCMYVLYRYPDWKLLYHLCAWSCYEPGDVVPFSFVDAYQYFIDSYCSFLLTAGSHLLDYVLS